MRTISDILHAAVEQAVADGESINAIAKASGVPQPSLHRFYCRERTLTLETAERLANHFRLELRPAGRRRAGGKR